MAQDVWLADRRHARPRFDRIVEPRLERLRRQPSATRHSRRTERACQCAARYPLRHPSADPDPGIHDCRGPDAGARHRRHQRHLQRRQRRAAAAAALPESRLARARARSGAEVRSVLCRSGNIPRLAAAELRVRTSGGGRHDRRDAGGLERGGAPCRRPRLVGHLRSPSGHAGARPDLSRRRRRAGEGRRHRPESRHVAAPVRRRPDDPGPFDHAQRRSGDSHRRDASGIRVHVGRRVLAAAGARAGPVARRPFPRSRRHG